MLTQLAQTSLERELSELKREFLLMHNRTSKAVTLAFEALLEQNPDKAKRAIASDTEIDEWQTMLEQRCLEIIAKHQLLASDVRFVTGVLSSVADFERAVAVASHLASRGLTWLGMGGSAGLAAIPSALASLP